MTASDLRTKTSTPPDLPANRENPDSRSQAPKGTRARNNPKFAEPSDGGENHASGFRMTPAPRRRVGVQARTIHVRPAQARRRVSAIGTPAVSSTVHTR